MKLFFLLLTSLALLPASASLADARELSQSELRAVVSVRDAIPTRRLISGVEDHTGGEVVEVRAFMFEEMLTYRVLFRMEDGHLGAILVDGETGHAVDDESGRNANCFATEHTFIVNPNTTARFLLPPPHF